MLQLIEHTQNYLDWRTVYGTAAVHCCQSFGTTGTEPRMSTLHGTRATPVHAAMRHTWQVSSDCFSLSAVVDDPVLSFLLCRLLSLLLVVVILSVTGIQHDVERCRVRAKTVANGAKKLLYDE